MQEKNEINQIDKDFSEIKIDNIKKFVDKELNKLGLYDRIKHLVEVTEEEFDEDKIIEKIKNAGIVEEVLEKFKSTDEIKSETFNKSKKCLYLKLVSGRGFVDYARKIEESSYFQFDILFFGQRFQSKKIYTAPEYVINESFLLDFNPLQLEIDVNLNLLRKISSPIHIALVLIHCDSEKTLIAKKSLEWRWVLCYGTWKIETELYNTSTLNKLNVGILDIQISLIPFVDKSNLIPERIIFEQLNDEKKSETESN
jgi:hypothetical protein